MHFEGKYRYISKKKKYLEKGQYFVSLISESENYILYRFITQSEIFQVFISWNFDDYGLQIMKTQKIEYYIRQQKRIF